MDKIVDYEIAEAKNVELLTATVKTLITQGWQPHGSVIVQELSVKSVEGRVTERKYCQPMVKYESQK